MHKGNPRFMLKARLINVSHSKFFLMSKSCNQKTLVKWQYSILIRRKEPKLNIVSNLIYN